MKPLYIYLSFIIIPYIGLMIAYIINIDNLSEIHRNIGSLFFTIITIISCLWLLKMDRDNKK